MKQKTKKLLTISLLLTIGVMLVFIFGAEKHSLENFGATKLAIGSGPIWSNDGSKIFFIRNDYTSEDYPILVMDSDGSNQKRLAEGSHRALSPDGTKIFYIQTLEGLYQAWTMYSDGSKREKIGEFTFIPSKSAGNPSLYSWSSDRTKIFYYTPDNGFQYWIWDMEKNETRQLTTFGYDEIGGVTVFTGMPAGGTWSPDNKKIVLSQPALYDDVFSAHIWTIDSESGKKEMLTPFIGENIYPVWSPNGKDIMYIRQTERDSRMYEIWVMGSDGSNKTQLTDSPMYEDGEWSPDGEKIAYISIDLACMGNKNNEHVKTNKSEIWVMDADGADKKQLLSIPCNKGLITELEWSPDGSKIAFVWWPEPLDLGQFGIYVIDVPDMNDDGKK